MKTIGINIDGIIRDSFNKFDSQYRKVFIHNPCLVAMNENDMTMREFTDQEMDEIICCRNLAENNPLGIRWFATAIG